MPASKLPSFFIVGVQKAGTTALHAWLSKQAGICLPRKKETHFFSHEDRFKNGLDWYLDEFPACRENDVIGEIDPDYSYIELTPERIKRFIDAPRFIFIFRHPLERAYSHYLMSVRRGYEPLSFANALDVENKRSQSENTVFFQAHHSYMARGQYCKQIMRFKQIFPEARFCFIKFDDLFDEEISQALYAGICEFIGLSSKPIKPDLNERINQASRPHFTYLRNLVYGESRLKDMARKVVPRKLRGNLAYHIDQWNRVPVSTPAESGLGAAPPWIREQIESEVAALQPATGLNLDDWIGRV